MRGFDKHMEELLAKNPEFALEYAKVLAEMPIQTQLAIMRRKRQLTQRGLAKKAKVSQPHIARSETLSHDPRFSSIVRAAKALRCHVLLVPDEQLSRISAA